MTERDPASELPFQKTQDYGRCSTQCSRHL